MDIKEIKNYFLPYFQGSLSAYLPGIELDLKSKSTLLDLSDTDLKEKLSELDQVAKNAALELLKEDGLIELLEKLPFKDNETVILIGDTSSDEFNGWLSILEHMLKIGLDKEIKFINRSVTLQTSSDILKNLGQSILSEEPEWIILNYGTSDARRLNYASDRTLISLTEFWENTQSIQLAIESLKTRNPIIWMAPSLVYEESANEFPFFNSSFSNTEIRQFQDIIRDKKGIQVDPYFNRFGKELNQWEYALDGVHFSVSGNMKTVKAFIKSMAEYKNKKGA